MEHGYDIKCEELARHFLEDEDVAANPERVRELAQRIQDAIEDFLAE